MNTVIEFFNKLSGFQKFVVIGLCALALLLLAEVIVFSVMKRKPKKATKIVVATAIAFIVFVAMDHIMI